MRKVTLLYFDGCPNWQVADDRLRQLADEVAFTLERRQIDTPEQAERAGFSGSPTVLVDGTDPFATGTEPTGLACRIYATEEGTQGAPTLEQLRTVLVQLDAAAQGVDHRIATLPSAPQAARPGRSR